MRSTTHQTARLSMGKHKSPTEGTCVMELASMLSGEGFTDSPPSVCPVIRDLLHSYNDRVDDERRQELYACAAAVLGSRSTPLVERERLLRCAEAARGLRWEWRALLTFPLFPLQRHSAFRAGWALATSPDGSTEMALALVGDLLAARADGAGDPPAVSPLAPWSLAPAAAGVAAPAGSYHALPGPAPARGAAVGGARVAVGAELEGARA